MKKTKLLLPALTIASTAAIVAPFATSCGLDWKPSASATHDAFSNHVYNGYTSKAKLADEKTFTVDCQKSLIADMENIAKAVCQEIKTNAAGMLDDIMIDAVGYTQTISYYVTKEIMGVLPVQNPTFFKTYVATYDAASYKIMPDFDWPTVILYFNFDFKLDMYDDTNVPLSASLEIKARNVPFVVENFAPLVVCYLPEILTFTSFDIKVNSSFTVAGESVVKNVEFTDYYQFFDKDNLEIAYMLDWMLDNNKVLYHFQNWIINWIN